MMGRPIRGDANATKVVSLVSDSDRARLMEVWEASVRATHHFLSEQDLQTLIPLAHQELATISPIHCLRDAEGSVYAFMAVVDRKIDALFVDPAHRATGAGRRLVQYAIEELDARAVDVNEQNPAAVGFYEHVGFTVVARSGTDAQGLPFPILHMELVTRPRSSP
jgi:putative acetyltransferase